MNRISAALPQSEFTPFLSGEIEQSIARRFERQVRRVPERIAVKTPRGELTYAALDDLGNRVAGAILTATGRRSTAVAILLEQGTALIGAIVGVLKAGRPYVGLDPAHASEALQRTLGHCEAEVLLTNRRNRALAARVARGDVVVIEIDALESAGTPGAPDVPRFPDDPAYIYYTSGSTGVPKGVVDSQRNVLHNVMRYTNSLRIGETDRLTLLQSVAFSGSVSSLFCAILNGATCFPIDLAEMGIEGLAAWMAEQQITIYHSVPSIFQRVVETGREWPHLRVIRLEGDQMSRTHLELFRARFPPHATLVNGLGATETGISCQFPIRPDTVVDGSVVPVGFATTDMQSLILDSAGVALPAGAVGEIAIKSRYLATGYWRQPELTAARFLPDPNGGPERIYRTGDLGRLTAEGCLEYLGRSDSVLKLHGRWVDVHATEVALRRLAGVRDAVVIVRENKSGHPELTAYVVPDPLSPPALRTLRRQLAAHSPEVALPSRFVPLAELPLDANGKVKRGALPEPDWSRPVPGTEFVAPNTALEMTLARIWAHVLKLERVGIRDDFGELGGDSLQAIEIAAQVEHWLGQKLPASIILEAPCVEEMARRLGRPAAGEESLVVIQPTGSRRPLFYVHDNFGDPIGCGPLAQRLGPDQPLFGLRMRGLNGQVPWHDSFEAMASHYVAEIRRVQPCGPYCVAGECIGGVIALEMAQQLRAAGEEVALLALLDTGWTDARLRAKLRKHFGQMAAKKAGEKVRHVIALAGRAARRAIRKFARARTHETNAGPAGAVLPSNAVVAHLYVLERRYRARRYDGKVAVVIVGPVRNHLAGLKVSRRNVRVISLPAADGRDTHLMHPANVGALADVLRRLIEDAEAARPRPA